MNFLADTWVMWLIISAVSVGVMVFYRQSRRGETSSFTSADDFSITTILFDLRKGEGDLFIGFLLSMVSFSFFVAGLVRWLLTIF